MSTNEPQPQHQPDSGAPSQPTRSESPQFSGQPQASQSQPSAQSQQPQQPQSYSSYPQPQYPTQSAQPPYQQYQPNQQSRQYPPYPQQPQYQQPQYQPYQPYQQYQPYPYAYPPQPPVDPETVRRRTLRKAVGRVAGLALAYQAIFTATSLIAGMVIGLAAATSRYGSQAMSGMFSEQELSQFEQEIARQTVQWTGALYILAVAVGFAFMLLMRHRTILTRAFWTGDPREPHAAMRPAWLLAFAAMLVGVQGVSIVIQVAFAALGTPLASPTSEGIEESAVTVSMWLYIGLIGPIIEELVFRGVVMKELKPLGRNFAILTSSLMFALFHDDVVQGLFAFACGLIFAFVAMEYSLVWSIALHVFNNAVIGGVFSAIADRFGDTGNVVYAVCLVIVGVGGLIWVLLKYGWGLKEYVRVNRSAPGTYWGWTSGLFLTLVILNVLIALVSFAMAMAGAA